VHIFPHFCVFFKNYVVFFTFFCHHTYLSVPVTVSLFMWRLRDASISRGLVNIQLYFF
jgi:hypothetical protein